MRLPVMLAGFVPGFFAPVAAQQGLYTCTDASGRRHTSDRSIPECSDREQRVLSPNGVLLRTVRPPPTAAELQAQEEAARQEALTRQREDQERRRDISLLARYPDRATYQQARDRALAAASSGAHQERLRDRFDQELRRLEALWPPGP